MSAQTPASTFMALHCTFLLLLGEAWGASVGCAQLQMTFWPSLLTGPYLQEMGDLVAGALDAAVGGPGSYLPPGPEHCSIYSETGQHAGNTLGCPTASPSKQ